MFEVRDLGVVAYRPCVEIQSDLLERVASGDSPNTLLLVEHPPVITLGANTHDENLLLPRERYAQMGIELETTGRGGDVTYHGPGQLVAYPIFHLDVSGKNLHLWLRDLEGVVISALSPLGLNGYRFPPHTGVWVDGLKVCAIGIKVRRWVSMHGLALNCNNDLTPFASIVPCGIQGYGVTSLSELLGRDVGVGEVKRLVVGGFKRVFGGPHPSPLSRDEHTGEGDKNLST